MLAPLTIRLSFVTFVNVSFLPQTRVPCLTSVVPTLGPHQEECRSKWGLHWFISGSLMFLCRLDFFLATSLNEFTMMFWWFSKGSVGSTWSNFSLFDCWLLWDIRQCLRWLLARLYQFVLRSDLLRRSPTTGSTVPSIVVFNLWGPAVSIAVFWGQCVLFHWLCFLV